MRARQLVLVFDVDDHTATAEQLWELAERIVDRTDDIDAPASFNECRVVIR